jgi:hypothetical protein
MSSASSSAVPLDSFRLFGRTTFGFGNPLHWLSAVQRVVFFLLAIAGELLAATKLFGWLIDRVTRGADFLLTMLTPHAAADLENEPRRDGLRILIWATALAALVISLGGNALFTGLAKTFYGDDPRRFYYASDIHNLVLYTFVAPVYMAASASIIYCALSSFSLTNPSGLQGGWASRVWPIVRLGLVLSGIVLIAGQVQVNYFEENIMGLTKADPESLKPACRGKLFWFVDEFPEKNGAIIRLNSAGVYYLCMQFCHMAVVAAAVWFLITAMFNLYHLGLVLTPDFLVRNGGADPVHAKLKRFSLLEVSAKWLALILTVHIAIWGDSCLKGKENIRAMAMVLLALQFFVLATPRLLIEYRLLRCAAVDAPSTSSNVVWPDLIDQRDKVKSTVVSCVHFLVQLALFMLAIRLITFVLA